MLLLFNICNHRKIYVLKVTLKAFEKMIHSPTKQNMFKEKGGCILNSRNSKYIVDNLVRKDISSCLFDGLIFISRLFLEVEPQRKEGCGRTK